MKRILFTLSAFSLAVGGLALAATSQAASGVDLGINGSVVAGVRSGQSGLELGFAFTATNHSSSASADLMVTFSVTHATVQGSDYICPLISNKYDINADTPSCEVGTLSAGSATQVALLATPSGTGTVTVRACASNMNGTPDPVSSNNCKTLRVPIG